MKNILLLLIVANSMLIGEAGCGEVERMIIGSYNLKRMKEIKPLTLPRLHLYDSTGALIDRANWPKELAALRVMAGEAYCCVSDSPPSDKQDGTPANCTKVIYGEEVYEHFVGLHDQNKNNITYNTLPKHRYLFVEYYADWCSPCIPTCRAMEAFLSSPQGKDYLVVVIDFTGLANKK